MEPTLKVIPGRDWPLDAVTQKFAWLGRTGSGKSFGCKRFVEQMLKAGAQVLVVDTVGVWHGLRQGEHGFDIPVLGGLYGDIPLEPTAGELVAEVAVQSGQSMVLDVSQMNDAQRARFLEPLGRKLFELKKASPGAMHIVLDEGQDAVPQNPLPNENMMLHEWVRIGKQGRAFGMGLSIVSQRPQEISKKALNQVECVLAFQLTGAHERKALEYWLSDKGIDTKLAQTLPQLEVGVPFVWSPQWLKMAEVTKRVLPIESADTSQTPKVGDGPRARREMKPIDLTALQQSMAEMVEKVKDSDPALLRKRIKELEAQLAGKAPALGPKRVKELVQVVRQGDEITTKGLDAAVSLVMDVEEALRKLHVLLDATKPDDGRALAVEEFFATATFEASERAQPLPKSMRAQFKAIVAAEGHLPEPIQPRPKVTLREKATAAREGRLRSDGAVEDKSGLPSGEAAVLQAVAQYGDRGVRRTTIMVMTGYKQSYVGLCLQNLRAHSDGPLIDRPQPGLVVINALGTKHLPKSFKPFPTGKKLIKHLIDTLPSGESKVLACINANHPKETPVEAVRTATGFKVSYVGLCVQNLVSRKAVARVRPGVVHIHPEVFA